MDPKSSVAGVIVKEETAPERTTPCEDGETGRERLLCEDRGRDLSDDEDSRDHQQAPETGRGEEGLTPRAFRESVALPAS